MPAGGSKSGGREHDRKELRGGPIPGDGIGPEVIGEASRILEAAGRKYGFSLTWADYPFAPTTT